MYPIMQLQRPQFVRSTPRNNSEDWTKKCWSCGDG